MIPDLTGNRPSNSATQPHTFYANKVETIENAAIGLLNTAEKLSGLSRGKLSSKIRTPVYMRSFYENKQLLKNLDSRTIKFIDSSKDLRTKIDSIDVELSTLSEENIQQQQAKADLIKRVNLSIRKLNLSYRRIEDAFPNRPFQGKLKRLCYLRTPHLTSNHPCPRGASHKDEGPIFF